MKVLVTPWLLVIHMDGLTIPRHNLPLLSNGVMEGMIESVRNSSVYWLEQDIKVQHFTGILDVLGGTCSVGLSRGWMERRVRPLGNGSPPGRVKRLALWARTLVWENYYSLPLETKGMSSLGHLMTPCLIILSYSTCVRCCLSPILSQYTLNCSA